MVKGSAKVSNNKLCKSSQVPRPSSDQFVQATWVMKDLVMCTLPTCEQYEPRSQLTVGKDMNLDSE